MSRHTEADYVGALLDAVSLDDCRAVVGKPLTMAKEGDGWSRAWLLHYIMGRPAATTPAALTVVVQQLAGRDPVVEKLAHPHIERLTMASLRLLDQKAIELRKKFPELEDTSSTLAAAALMLAWASPAWLC